VAGRREIADAADAGRLRDALGVALPVGLPAAYTESNDAPLRSLVERYSRTHGPFTAAAVAHRLGVPVETAQLALASLEADERVLRGEFRPGGSGTEFCDPEVLRMIRRRTLAALRRDVEAVDPEVLGRFLPAWQRVGSTAKGPEALADVVSQLAGAPLVASSLDVEVLAPRLGDYRPADLDAMCTAGELVWVGAGGIGTKDGRVRLVFRSDTALLSAALSSIDAEAAPGDPHHVAIRERLRDRGASFWTDLLAAVAAADLPYDDATVLDALWDLVWAGEVTNDSFAPLRAKVVSTSKRSSPRRTRSRGLRSMSAAPPAGAGRWSLVADLVPVPPTSTEVSHAQTLQLLDRYGVLTREMALAEGIVAGFAGVYPVLKAMEEQGQIRRGYFVAGLGAAQFATHAAVDRLRQFRSVSDGTGSDAAVGSAFGAASEPTGPPFVLAATDPAQPYGAALPWPDNAGRPTRSAGARVVLADGHPVAWLDRSGRNLVTFPAAGDHPEWVGAVAGLVRSGRVRRLEITTVDGAPVSESSWADPLREAGFLDGYRGLILRS